MQQWAQVLVPIAAAVAFIFIAVASIFIPAARPALWALPPLLLLILLLWPDREPPVFELARTRIERSAPEPDQRQEPEQRGSVTRLPKGSPPDAGA